MYPHRIRLRGPWECEPLQSSTGAALPAARRMTMPCRWRDGGLPDFAGRVRFRRRFGLPRQIDAEEHLWLHFAGLTGRAAMALNGTSLGECAGETASGEFEVTTLLRERNELLVELAGSTDAGLWGEVALVIRRSAYLRDVRLLPEGGVAGAVAGVSPRPLDLYLLHDGKSAAHTMATAGQAFQIAADAPVPAAGELRVELVDGGVVWDAVVLEMK